jgi:hypothetical protein
MKAAIYTRGFFPKPHFTTAMAFCGTIKVVE